MTLLSHSRVTGDGLQTVSHLNGKAGVYLTYTPTVDHAGGDKQYWCTNWCSKRACWHQEPYR